MTHTQSEWLDNCLSTIDTDYPIIVYTNDTNNSGYELGALSAVLKDTNYEEIFLLQDTHEVKDNALFDILFKEHKGKSVYMSPVGYHYCVKYLRKKLNQIDIPAIKSKEDSIKYELQFHRWYTQLHTNSPIILDNNFINGPNREEKFGRENMVIENQWLKKYKGTWQ